MEKIPQVFISSTSKDLHEYRDRAIAVCNELNFHPIAMEYFEAMETGATASSKQKLDKADVCVYIIAHRYGYIEDGYNTSVTETEFDYAAERKLDRLAFIIDPNYRWPPELIDYEHIDKLKDFKAKVEKELVRKLFTNVDNFGASLYQALIGWRDRHPELWDQQMHVDSLRAILIEKDFLVPELPPQLIGRDRLISDINQKLDDRKRILLTGISGMGKTALAATIASRRIASNQSPALWLQFGDNNLADLFQALVSPFGGQLSIRNQKPEARAVTVLDLLGKSPIKLIVLDDVADTRGTELSQVLNAIPRSISIIITSQYEFPTDEPPISVDKLQSDDAIKLISYFAEFSDIDIERNTEVQNLCDYLDNNPFALRLAGLTMKVGEVSPSELLDSIKLDIANLYIPGNFAPPGRENVIGLIETSLNKLDQEVKDVFLMFGAFFAPGATLELLLRYMKRIKEGETEAYRGKLKKALRELQRRGLIQRGLVTSDNRFRDQGDGLDYYRIHNLSYTYAKLRTTSKQRFEALEACLTYTRRFSRTDEETPERSYTALRLELDNFLGAAKWAMEEDRYTDVEEFVRNLYHSTQMLDKGRFYEQAIELLKLGTEAAHRNQGIYFTNLGQIYRDSSRYQEALDALTKAREIYKDIGDKPFEGVVLGYLGLTHADQGENEDAITYCDMALEYAKSPNDDRGDTPRRAILNAKRLGNLGLSYAYRNQGDYARAVRHLEEAITITRNINDPSREGRYLGYLGLIYSYMGEMGEAIDRCKKGLEVVEQLEDEQDKERTRSVCLGYLGNFYADLGEFQEAIRCSEEAQSIARKVVDRRGEGNRMGDLGQIYHNLGDYQKAINLHQQGLAIMRQIGAQRSIGYRLAGLIQSNLALGKLDDDTNQLITELRQLESNQLSHDLHNPRDQQIWGTVVALNYLYRNSLSAALEAAKKARESDNPVNRHFVAAVYGVILTRRNERQEANIAFNEAITYANSLLSRTSGVYSAHYTRGLAYSALALLSDDNQYSLLLKQAHDAYEGALMICKEKGVINDAILLFDQLYMMNSQRLGDIRKLLVRSQEGHI